METPRLTTGIKGLDDILSGGLIAGRAYMVRGGPGAGKTTLGLHFLSAQKDPSEGSLYLSLGNSEAWIRKDASQIGFDLKGIKFLDLSPRAETFAEAKSYNVFPTAEVERGPISALIIKAIETHHPKRVFLDAMTQLRNMTSDPMQFRNLASSLFAYLKEKGITLLFSSEASAMYADDDLQFASDGIIHLEDSSVAGRTLTVQKFLGSAFNSGQHGMRLTDHGMFVFPRLVPSRFRSKFPTETLSSGIGELDTLLHGGLKRGTIALITGPSGAGKTTLGTQFLTSASRRDENSLICLFDEGKEALLERSRALNIPVVEKMERGTLSIMELEPLLHSADEFATMLRDEVENKGVKTVMIDTLEGYRLALRGEAFEKGIRAIWRYLSNMGVTLIVTSEVENIVGELFATKYGISYLADDIIFFRYFEANGEIRRAIGVLKKRFSDFEKTLREVQFSARGIQIGPPLTDISAILPGLSFRKFQPQL